MIRKSKDPRKIWSSASDQLMSFGISYWWMAQYNLLHGFSGFQTLSFNLLFLRCCGRDQSSLPFQRHFMAGCHFLSYFLYFKKSNDVAAVMRSWLVSTPSPDFTPTDSHLEAAGVDCNSPNEAVWHRCPPLLRHWAPHPFIGCTAMWLTFLFSRESLSKCNSSPPAVFLPQPAMPHPASRGRNHSGFFFPLHC